MDELKTYIMIKMEEIHIKLYYQNTYGNTELGLFEKLQDTIRYEQLKEIVMANPAWDNETFNRELSKRIDAKVKLR